MDFSLCQFLFLLKVQPNIVNEVEDFQTNSSIILCEKKKSLLYVEKVFVSQSISYL